VSANSAYAAALAEGRLKPDAAQYQVWQRLEKLNLSLATQPKSFWQRMSRTSSPPPRGLYIHGEVGRGKTMLMDLFFNSVQGIPKRRVHFHAFMQEVHAKRSALRSDDVINTIADDLASDSTLLCLDEMQITDIADAMIIGRLFEALEKRGMCVVTTSNVPPEGLYKDGLNRQLFLPFITKLQNSLDVISLDSPHDYRLGRIKSHETFITPLGPQSTARLDRLWHDLTDGDTAEPMDIEILGRTLHVPAAAHSCARFSFSSLCESPLGPPDYLVITKTFRTVFIDGIPVLKTSQRNEAKRLVLMIDTFYDAGTRLVATAAAAPEGLYPKGQHGFEFKRTISRLREMQSASWWGKAIPET
jgi:cell division protein ZapE